MSAPSLIGSLLGGAADVAKTVNNGNISTTDTGVAQSVAPQENYEQSKEAVQSIPLSTKEAQTGVAKAADIEKTVGAPIAGQNIQAAQGVQGTGQGFAGTAIQNYQQAVQAAHNATLKAETSLQKASEAAKIDPQQYLNNMGVDQRVMTSLGMLFSGIGAGKNGTNLAYDTFQKNTDRAIAAQQANFENIMKQAATQAGMADSAANRQSISAQAYNMATMSVVSGIQSAMEGANFKIKSMAAPEIMKMLQNDLGIKNSNAQNSFGQIYKKDIQAKDTRTLNMLGQAMDKIGDKIAGKGTNTNQRFESVKGNDVPPEVQKQRDLLFKQDQAAPGSMIPPMNKGPLTNPESFPSAYLDKK